LVLATANAVVQAVVTGGGTGIGKTIAHELCLLGCSVVLASRYEHSSRPASLATTYDKTAYVQCECRTLETLVAAADEIKAQLPTKHSSRSNVVVPIACDVRDEGQVKRLFERVMSVFHRVDYVVNNGVYTLDEIHSSRCPPTCLVAGGQFVSPFENLSLNGWNAVHRLNSTGTFLVTKYAFEAYLKDHGGAIVNVLVAMDKGFPYASHSGASRAAVENLTKSLAYEWASRGIRVNAVTPVRRPLGQTDNVMVLQGTIESSGLKNYGPVAQQVCESYSANTPARRLGTVEEVSAAVVFLLSPAAAYTTGTNALVDGGWNLAGALVPLPQHIRYPVYGASKL
ncbi:hypothetical protein DYB32_010110, partial [Aphanomyces invadans]